MLLLLCMEELWQARNRFPEPAAKILASLSLPCLTLCLSREGSPSTGEDAASVDTSRRLKDISSLFLCSV